jgi:predicted RNA binding protein YcfA (HicA-like mRNA interferase family)
MEDIIVKDKDLLKALLKDGWTLTRIHGSHHIVEKNGKIETIPIHGKDVPKGLLSAIKKRTGLK